METGTNVLAVGIIVVGLGPEDVVADAAAGVEEVGGQAATGLVWGWEGVSNWIANHPAIVIAASSTIWDLTGSAVHKKNASPSKKKKHQEGQSRKKRDRGNEKGETKPPRIKPPKWKGPWPPKTS